MSDWAPDGSPMPVARPSVTLGRLTLIKRKGGGDVQSIPLDAERITFGRDYDCDVRLYYSDVSKLHCEILFDPISGMASLNVLGTNGLLHTPAGGSSSTYKPPATIELSDRDLITIRKKPFRFEYGTGPEAQIPASPCPVSSSSHQAVVSPIKWAPGSPAQGLRRRASHRLSLVPEGKTFVPLSPAKNRRHSTLGLGEMRTPAKTASKSKLSEEIPQEQGEEEEEVAGEPVIDMANGEEGDKVYIEMTEEEQDKEEEVVQSKPIHKNPFMTPQQTRKAPLRNTSAVPRTRKVANPNSTSASEEVAPEHQVERASEVDTTPATPPKSPRSVPLPAAMDTPYNPPATPASQKMSATPVPARVALSTPKGPATLRKALLLRSARKVWQESNEAGVEGAIQKGNVETRRKSLSPITRSGRKSVTPVPESPMVQLGHDEEIQEDVPESAEAEAPTPSTGELRWVHEDGTAEASFESDSSGGDSLEADMSLDIPGKGVIDFSSTVKDNDNEEGHINENPQIEEEDEDIDMDVEEDENDERDYEDHEKALKDPIDEVESWEEVIDEGGRTANDHVEYEEALKLPTDQSMEADEDAQADEDDEEGGDEAMSLPGTPQSRKPLSSQFFTPQLARGSYGHGRRSLGGVGGAPVRLGTMPSTPNSLRPIRTPGSLGKPSRGVWTTVPVPTQDMDFEEPVEPKPRKPATPARTAASIAEMQRQRENLATPRTLPAPPPSGFKDPVRETRFTNLIATPGHRALASPSPEPEEQQREGQAGPVVPGTPIADLKKRLDKVRRQSTQRTDRRATVGFALPSTPSQPIFNQAGSHSVNPRRIIGKGPQTPIFPKFKREDSSMIASGSMTHLAAPQAEGKAEPEQDASFVRHQEPSSPVYEPPSSPSTPLYTGLKEMLKLPRPATTPNMAGIKTLFPATPNETATPSFVGVKELLKQPTVAATPSFSGMKEMFRQRPEPPTPVMEGLNEMYEAEVEDEEMAEMDQTEDVIAVDGTVSPKENARKPVSNAPVKTAADQHLPAKVVESNSEVGEEEEEEEEEIEEIEIKSEQGTVMGLVKRASPLRTTATSSVRTISAFAYPSRSQRAASPKKFVPKASAAAPAAAVKATSRLPARRAAPAKAAEKAKADEPALKPIRSRKAPETTAASRSEPSSRPSRSTRAASVASTDNGKSSSSRVTAAAPSASRSRSTRARSTAEPEEVPQIASEPVKTTARSRSTSSRTTKKAEEEEDSKPSRGKKPLTQIEEQVKGVPAPMGAEEKKSTSSRAKKATPATAPATTAATGRTTTTKASVGEEKVSAPSKRKAAASAIASIAATKDKENDETQVEDKKSISAASRRRVVSKTSAEETKSAGAAVPVARATRSRK
ncbi:hypothetical protein IAU59_001097 [Kwoniella sp. CBS 9459]